MVAFTHGIFDRGPRRPPSWAEGFDAERFAVFVRAVSEQLEDRGLEPEGDLMWSGSLFVPDQRGYQQEWILHEVASRCAKADPADYPRLLAEDSLCRMTRLTGVPMKATRDNRKKRRYRAE